MQRFIRPVLPALAALAMSLCRAASETPPPPDYPPALIEAGKSRFTADCGFCHGRDATGGSRGLDLTRSPLVAEDSNGDLIGAVLSSGRPDKGMPAFSDLSADDVRAIAAYIHLQSYLAETAVGGRRSVLPADLATGDPDAGRAYFSEYCSNCHSANGDLQGIAARQGLGLLQDMLYPRAAALSSATVTVSDDTGQTVSGTLAYQDEFTIALRDSSGRYRSWPVERVSSEIAKPLQAHIDQLSRYTDKDMHDVYAFLLTLE